jgi:ATP-dependent protease HslVU (ClpYQ) ATPase subunit
MQDRPTAQELLKAAKDFVERDLLPALEGRVQFHARVLQNVLSILEREWEGEETAVRAEYDRLRALLALEEGQESFAELRESVRAANTELAKKIRSGEMDDRFDETLVALDRTVQEKLAIANPNWFGD